MTRQNTETLKRTETLNRLIVLLLNGFSFLEKEKKEIKGQLSKRAFHTVSAYHKSHTEYHRLNPGLLLNVRG